MDAVREDQLATALRAKLHPACLSSEPPSCRGGVLIHSMKGSEHLVRGRHHCCGYFFSLLPRAQVILYSGKMPANFKELTCKLIQSYTLAPGRVSTPRPHSWEAAEPGWNPGPFPSILGPASYSYSRFLRSLLIIEPFPITGRT